MPTETLPVGALLEALDDKSGPVPRAAMEQALRQWDEVGPILRRLMDDEPDESGVGETALFRGIYLMAQLRDQLAYRPLCQLVAGDDTIREIIQELIEDLAAMLVRVFDGDPHPLRQLAEAGDADQFARAAGLDALVYLTANGRLDRAETAETLEDLSQTLRPPGSYVWAAWAEAIASLGLETLMPLVEHAFKVGAIDEMYLELDNVKATLASTLAGDEPDRIVPEAENVDALDDVIGFMEGWHAADVGGEEDYEPVPEPIRNPLRNVGRNDPCPCGSGRKYKKCCLAAASA